MRYSAESKFRKYVKGYGFLSFVRKFGDKYGKKINRYCNKNWSRCCKNCFTASKRVVKETAEAIGDLIGNKIAGKFTSLGKTKSDGKEKVKEEQEIYIPPEKNQQVIDDLRLF